MRRFMNLIAVLRAAGVIECKPTRHGAMRIKLGKGRLHIDSDGMTWWLVGQGACLQSVTWESLGLPSVGILLNLRGRRCTKPLPDKVGVIKVVKPDNDRAEDGKVIGQVRGTFPRPKPPCDVRPNTL